MPARGCTAGGKQMEDKVAEKALIAMSGGVDSSVAAFLTREQGLDKPVS